METKEVVQTLSAIPIGTIIAWVVVIAGIITAIIAATIKMYKVFETTHRIKEENDEFKKMVKEHDELLKSIKDDLADMKQKQLERDKADFVRLKYSIVRAAEEYISKNEITIRQLKSLEENYEEYHKNHGNSYVTTLMWKVRKLPVLGALDENGEDIPQ